MEREESENRAFSRDKSSVDEKVRLGQGTSVDVPSSLQVHDQILALVPFVDLLLAAGAGGVSALSAGVADSIAVSDCRNCGRRGPGVGKGNYFSARTIAAPNCLRSLLSVES